jgi:hypothetical protein
MKNIKVVLSAIAAILSAVSGGKDLVPVDEGERGA